MAIVFSLQRPAEDDIQKAFNTSERGAGSNFLEPGRYDVKIKSAGALEPSSKDPTWLTTKITYEAASGGTTNEFLALPTSSPYFNGKLAAFNRVVRFFAALGIEVNLENINEVLNKYFTGDMNRFVGLQLGITLGYMNHFGKYMNGKYALCQNDGQLVPGAPSFDTREALENYCRMQNIGFSKYPNVRTYHVVPGVNNDFSVFEEAPSTPRLEVVEDEDDLPF